MKGQRHGLSWFWSDFLSESRKKVLYKRGPILTLLTYRMKSTDRRTNIMMFWK